VDKPSNQVHSNKNATGFLLLLFNARAFVLLEDSSNVDRVISRMRGKKRGAVKCLSPKALPEHDVESFKRTLN